jgi:hypothetical protein
MVALLQTDMVPSQAAIGALVNAVTLIGITGGIGLAGADIDGLRIALIERQRADRLHTNLIENRYPVDAGIG